MRLCEESDPWMRFAGAWKDDPDWDAFQEGIQRFREEMDRNVGELSFNGKFNEVLLWNS